MPTDSTKWNRYRYFDVIRRDDTFEVNCKTLLEHKVEDGIIMLSFEKDNHVMVKDWESVDYAYNMLQ